MASERSFAKFGAAVTDLEIAAQDRLADAETLLTAGRYVSAIAMGLYSLEISLKVVICKRLDLISMSKPFEIHELEQLLVLAGLSQKIRRIKRPRGVAKNWDELVGLAGNIDKYRYSSHPSWDHSLAIKVLGQLRDPPNGVLIWLLTQA